ncbi:MAG TPA: hypothetical protein VJ603_00340 [Paucimonas sp.]|nr:hypothetical protein [Paucimonas sp.]HJW56789.1 hypothetical protein [Burkholderiaceae bacterium]
MIFTKIVTFKNRYGKFERRLHEPRLAFAQKEPQAVTEVRDWRDSFHDRSEKCRARRFPAGLSLRIRAYIQPAVFLNSAMFIANFTVFIAILPVNSE